MIAVTLLQHGADTTIKNNNGKKVFERSLVKKPYRMVNGLTRSWRILQ